MDWRLQGIQLTEHQMVRVPGEPSDTRTFDPVVRAAKVERLSRAANSVLGAQYLVDCYQPDVLICRLSDFVRNTGDGRTQQWPPTTRELDPLFPHSFQERGPSGAPP